MIQFNNQNTFKEIHYQGNDIKKAYSSGGLVWEKTQPQPITGDYLTFVAEENGRFEFWPNNSNVIQYSKNGGEWTTGAYVIVSVNVGDKVMWKGNMTPSNAGIGTFSASTAQFTASGNVMSLLFGDNFDGQTSLSGYDSAFAMLFYNCSGLTSIEGLELPATTLADNCYYHMFYGCTSLTTIPSDLLLATTLAISCYNGMFRDCTSLVTVPQDLLPATTLANNCYFDMFAGCTSLVTVPQDLLPATTLANNCYEYMFSSCVSLTTIPSDLLPATTLARNCYYSMFHGCSGLTTIPSGLLPATTLARSCYEYMFEGCTSLQTAPNLPASTLASLCYHNMFYDCTNLNYIKCLATDISAFNCTLSWVNGVAANGTFVTPSSTNWASGADGIPNNWTRQNL